MNRRNVARLALAASLLGAGGALPAAALAQVNSQQGKWWNPEQVQSYPDRFPDRFEGRFHRDMFEGRWVAQDRQGSDDRGNWGGGWGGNWGGGWGGYGDNGGGWGGYGDNPRFRGGRFAMTLPDFLKIDQDWRMVSVADGRNRLLQVIAIDKDSRFDRNRTAFLTGEVRGRRLVAMGTDAFGRPMRQVMILRDDGNTLVIRTQVQRGYSGRIVETEKVYERA